MAADPTRLKKLAEISFQDILLALERVPRTAQLFYGSSDFKVYAIDLDVANPAPVPLSGAGHESYVTGVALAQNFVVSGSYDGRLIWWDAASKQQVRAVEAHGKWLRSVRATPDGKLIASVADDMVCKLWDAASGECLHTLVEHLPMTPHNYPSMLYAAAFSADGKLLATGDKVGHVAIWDVATAKKIGEVEAPIMYTWDPRQRRHSIGGIRSLAFSPDSSRLAVGGIGTIGNIDHLGGPARCEVFEWETRKRLHELSDDKMKGLVEQIVWHDSGDWFLTAGGDNAGFLTFYDAQSGKILIQEKAPMHVHAVAFSDDFERLYAVGYGKLASWELKGVEEQPVEAPQPA